MNALRISAPGRVFRSSHRAGARAKCFAGVTLPCTGLANCTSLAQLYSDAAFRPERTPNPMTGTGLQKTAYVLLVALMVYVAFYGGA
ncbi:MAG: hypothetical protein R3D84_11670 [Paracoccaceae bacterium]